VPSAIRCCDSGGHTSDGRRFKEAEEGDFDACGIADARQELHGEEGVTSQLKEIVMDANLFQSQQAAPQGRYLLFKWGTRGDVEVFEGRPERAGCG
jgi:hypothetical protein